MVHPWTTQCGCSC